MEISGAFNRSVLIPTTLGKGHLPAVPLALEFCCLWPVRTLRRAVQTNSFQRLTSKLSSQLTQFGSWQGWALQRKPRVGLPPTGLFAGWFPSRDSCQFPATGVVALSLGYLLLSYRTGCRLAGTRIAGSRNWCPPSQERWWGKVGSRATVAGSSSMGGRAARDGCAMARLSIALDTRSGCLGRAQPPPVPSGLLPGTLFFPPCPSVHPGCSVAPAPQQEDQGGQGQHKKEK